MIPHLLCCQGFGVAWLQPHPWSPWICGILDFCNLRVYCVRSGDSFDLKPGFGPLFQFLRRSQRRPVKFGPKPVHRAENVFASNDGADEPMSPRKVGQRDAQDQGDQPLTGQYQHDQPRRDKEYSYPVFDHLITNSCRRILYRYDGPALMFPDKVLRRKLDHH